MGINTDRLRKIEMELNAELRTATPAKAAIKSIRSLIMFLDDLARRVHHLESALSAIPPAQETLIAEGDVRILETDYLGGLVTLVVPEAMWSKLNKYDQQDVHIVVTTTKEE